MKHLKRLLCFLSKPFRSKPYDMGSIEEEFTYGKIGTKRFRYKK